MKNDRKYLGIKSWSVKDRPREKLQDIGKKNISDAELLAILLGSGSAGESALDLSKRILMDNDNNLNLVGLLSVEELCRYKGVGPAKAITLVAALELGIRRNGSIDVKNPKITSSVDIFSYMRPRLEDLKVEEFWIVMLDRSNTIIKAVKISIGGVNSTVVDSKVIFKKSLDVLASSIILVHNHPSGNRKPSKLDIQITEKLVAGGKLIGINVLDHIIVCKKEYYSFKDEGLV